MLYLTFLKVADSFIVHVAEKFIVHVAESFIVQVDEFVICEGECLDIIQAPGSWTQNFQVLGFRFMKKF
jgi:hypothetical protein